MARAEGAHAAPSEAALAGPDQAGALQVTVVCALAPHHVLQARVLLPVGATVLDALRASGLAAQLPSGMLDTLVMGVWGRVCEPGALLQPLDRVELTRPLVVDPKEARRLRYRRDGLQSKGKSKAKAKVQAKAKGSTTV